MDGEVSLKFHHFRTEYKEIMCEKKAFLRQFRVSSVLIASFLVIVGIFTKHGNLMVFIQLIHAPYLE